MSALLEQLKDGLTTESAEATEAIGFELAKRLPANAVLALHGDLGAGKTTLIRGLARGWGIEEPVTSPTFNLYSIYQGTRQLIHLDAYRLESGADLDSLMIEDFLKEPWCFAVEWPERIAETLPEDTIHLYLSITPERQHHIKRHI